MTFHGTNVFQLKTTNCGHFPIQIRTIIILIISRWTDSKVKQSKRRREWNSNESNQIFKEGLGLEVRSFLNQQNNEAQYKKDKENISG